MSFAFISHSIHLILCSYSYLNNFSVHTLRVSTHLSLFWSLWFWSQDTDQWSTAHSPHSRRPHQWDYHRSVAGTTIVNFTIERQWPRASYNIVTCIVEMQIEDYLFTRNVISFIKPCYFHHEIEKVVTNYVMVEQGLKISLFHQTSYFRTECYARVRVTEEF